MDDPATAAVLEIPKPKWNYVDVLVRDGSRVLRPSHVCKEYLAFVEPPRFVSEQVEVTIINNGKGNVSWARVLAHDAGATEIPIEILR